MNRVGIDTSGIAERVSASLRQFAEAMRINPYEGAMATLYVQGKVLELMADVLTGLGNGNPSRLKAPPPDQQLGIAARDILMANLANPPSIEELARQVGVSHRRLNEIFQSMYDAAPYHCLTQWRLEEARALLIRGDLSVKEVAYMMGYAHVSSFSHAFSRRFGEAPSRHGENRQARKSS